MELIGTGAENSPVFYGAYDVVGLSGTKTWCRCVLSGLPANVAYTPQFLFSLGPSQLQQQIFEASRAAVGRMPDMRSTGIATRDYEHVKFSGELPARTQSTG